jgi:hypothetical protein
MISVCTVVKSKEDKMVDIMINSILRYSPLIREIIISDATGHETSEETTCGVTIKRVFGPKVDYDVHEHALGLHAALDCATQKYVMFSDPDVFFCMDVGRYYLDLIQRYNLNIVGIQHYETCNQCYATFPTVINCMVEKATLPDQNWLEGDVKRRLQVCFAKHREVVEDYPLEPGKYLLWGPNRFWYLFPLQKRLYDVGCNLWLWNRERNGRWMSFGHRNNLYYTCMFATNFPLDGVVDEKTILHHLRGGSHINKDNLAYFKKLWNKHLLFTTPY